MKRAELIQLREKLGSIELNKFCFANQHGGNRRSKKFHELKKFQDRKFAHLKLRKDELRAFLLGNNLSARGYSKLETIKRIQDNFDEAKDLFKRMDFEG